MQDLWTQFKALADIEDEDERDAKEGELWDQHRLRVEKAKPCPACCDNGAHLRAYPSYDRLDAPPRFGVSVSDTWYAIKFCPWCAAPMPEFEYAPQPNEHYMICTDGGYYCDECGERLDSCYCLPRECAWKVRQ